MKLISSFVRGLLGLSTSPVLAPAVSEPVLIATPPEPVNVGALLDLALVMRERWAPDASFAEPKGESEMLIEAALARVFPEIAATNAECFCAKLELHEHCTTPCPSAAELVGFDARLSAFLAPITRPDVAISLDPSTVAPLAQRLETIGMRVGLAALAGDPVKAVSVEFGS